MLLKTIQLTNFRQYKGKQVISFSTDKEKNVTVILGQNTCGKTTLVQAFIWCLYGKPTFSDNNILNMEVYEDLLEKRSVGSEASVSVEIELIQNDKDYIIRRIVSYVKKDNLKTQKKQGFEIYKRNEYGGAVPLYSDNPKEQEKLIQNIIPQELSSYFFFWGERIENLSNDKNINKAVKDILGLSAIDNARYHLRSVISTYTRELSKKNELDKSNGGLGLEKDYTNVLSTIKSKQMELDAVSKNVKKYKALEDKAEEELLNNARSIGIKERYIYLKKDKKSTEDNIESKTNDIFLNFNYSPYKYFSSFLAEDAIAILDHLPKEESEGLVYQNKQSIEELLKRGRCICGADLSEGTESYLHVLNELKRLPPDSIKSISTNFKRQIINNTNSRQYIDSLKKALNELSKLKDHLEDVDIDINSLRSSVDESLDLEGLRKNKQIYQNKYLEQSRKEVELQKEIDVLKKRESRIKEEIDRLSANTETSRRFKRYMNYAERVHDLFNSMYETQEKEIREKLNELVKQYFNQIYHGKRNIYLDDNFQIKVTSRIGDKDVSTEESPGLLTVKNFSFIAALVELAKIKRNEDLKKSEDERSNTEPYPLVLDAPFSQADEVHVPKICNLLSQVAEQTIIVVMEKDWRYAAPVMNNKVGKMYTLNKVSETNTEIVKCREGEI